jgi:hypothetical protein
MKGTRYYLTPECFLFFMSRFICSTSAPEVQALKPLLKTRIEERVHAPGDGLALAMGLLACDAVGIQNHDDLTNLLSMQEKDGSFGPGWIYQYGRTGLQLGNRGLTTALAANAIKAQIKRSARASRRRMM